MALQMDTCKPVMEDARSNTVWQLCPVLLYLGLELAHKKTILIAELRMKDCCSRFVDHLSLEVRSSNSRKQVPSRNTDLTGRKQLQNAWALCIVENVSEVSLQNSCTICISATQLQFPYFWRNFERIRKLIWKWTAEAVSNFFCCRMR